MDKLFPSPLLSWVIEFSPPLPFPLHQVDHFTSYALVLLEASTQAQYFNVALQRWLSLKLEMLGAVMLLCVALLSVGLKDNVPVGLSGLSLTYALTLTALAKYLVNYATRAE